MSATHTIAQGNIGSLTHWARPGMELTSSPLLPLSHKGNSKILVVLQNLVLLIFSINFECPESKLVELLKTWHYPRLRITAKGSIFELFQLNDYICPSSFLMSIFLTWIHAWFILHSRRSQHKWHHSGGSRRGHSDFSLWPWRVLCSEERLLFK